MYSPGDEDGDDGLTVVPTRSRKRLLGTENESLIKPCRLRRQRAGEEEALDTDLYCAITATSRAPGAKLLPQSSAPLIGIRIQERVRRPYV